jgi:hypothetical protein
MSKTPKAGTLAAKADAHGYYVGIEYTGHITGKPRYVVRSRREGGKYMGDGATLKEANEIRSSLWRFHQMQGAGPHTSVGKVKSHIVKNPQDHKFRILEASPGMFMFFNDRGETERRHWVDAGGFGREGLRLFNRAYLERELKAIGLSRDPNSGILSIAPVSVVVDRKTGARSVARSHPVKNPRPTTSRKASAKFYWWVLSGPKVYSVHEMTWKATGANSQGEAFSHAAKMKSKGDASFVLNSAMTIDEMKREARALGYGDNIGTIGLLPPMPVKNPPLAAHIARGECKAVRNPKAVSPYLGKGSGGIHLDANSFWWAYSKVRNRQELGDTWTLRACATQEAAKQSERELRIRIPKQDAFGASTGITTHPVTLREFRQEALKGKTAKEKLNTRFNSTRWTDY